MTGAAGNSYHLFTGTPWNHQTFKFDQKWFFITSYMSLRIVIEIHHEIWNNEVLRPEFPLSLFNCNLCRVYTNSMGAQNGTGRKFTKARTYTKRCFIRHDMRKKIWRRWDHLLGPSAVSVCPLYQLEEKHHQIRAFILLIKVIAVRHHQIRVAFCQVDSITAVRHLVRGFPKSKTLVSRFFPTTGWRDQPLRNLMGKNELNPVDLTWFAKTHTFLCKASQLTVHVTALTKPWGRTNCLWRKQCVKGEGKFCCIKRNSNTVTSIIRTWTLNGTRSLFARDWTGRPESHR